MHSSAPTPVMEDAAAVAAGEIDRARGQVSLSVASVAEAGLHEDASPISSRCFSSPDGSVVDNALNWVAGELANTIVIEDASDMVATEFVDVCLEHLAPQSSTVLEPLPASHVSSHNADTGAAELNSSQQQASSTQALIPEELPNYEASRLSTSPNGEDAAAFAAGELASAGGQVS
jgi:hypothetical protein